MYIFDYATQHNSVITTSMMNRQNDCLYKVPYKIKQYNNILC
jgi:hypothetical protein